MSKEKLLLVGSGGLGRVASEVATQEYKCAFVDDFALIYTNSVIRTLAKVGKRVRIGSNVTISNEVIVPDDENIKNGVALY